VPTRVSSAAIIRKALGWTGSQAGMGCAQGCMGQGVRKGEATFAGDAQCSHRQPAAGTGRGRQIDRMAQPTALQPLR
jgi:hypothetical protein